MLPSLVEKGGRLVGGEGGFILCRQPSRGETSGCRSFTIPPPPSSPTQTQARFFRFPCTSFFIDAPVPKKNVWLAGRRDAMTFKNHPSLALACPSCTYKTCTVGSYNLLYTMLSDHFKRISAKINVFSFRLHILRSITYGRNFSNRPTLVNKQ